MKRVADKHERICLHLISWQINIDQDPKGKSASLFPSVFAGKQDVAPSEGRGVWQEPRHHGQAGVSSSGDRFAQPGGVPVNDDGGEQIEACQALRALERFRIKTACSECRPHCGTAPVTPGGGRGWHSVTAMLLLGQHGLSTLPTGKARSIKSLVVPHGSLTSMTWTDIFRSSASDSVASFFSRS